MVRDMHYRTKSLNELIDGYAFESGRGSWEDREATQKAIVNEVYARIKDTLGRVRRSFLPFLKIRV